MTNGALCSSHLDEIPAERCQLANTITLCEPNTKHQQGARCLRQSYVYQVLENTQNESCTFFWGGQIGQTQGSNGKFYNFCNVYPTSEVSFFIVS